jgi:hypothetical protein
VATPWLNRKGLGALLLLIGVAVIVVLLVDFFRAPDRGDYLARNERVLSELPLPSGAHERTRQVLRNEETVFGEQLAHTVGYTIYVTYSAPTGLTDDDIVHFYKRHLRGWRARSWSVDQTSFACFTRNHATVDVQPEGMELRGGASQKTYGIAVNHNGGSCD